MPLSAAPIAPPAAPSSPSEELLVAIEAGPLACEYQPIIRAMDETIWAYEALARFRVDGRFYAPDQVFRALHDQRERFMVMETRAKRFQLARRPDNARLFVNLDPDVCEGPREVQHWVRELAGQDGVIVEIIENTSVSNVEHVRRFTQTLNDSGVNVALDDIGGSKNLFSFDLLDDVSYLKLDRRWFERLDRDPAYRALIGGMVSFAQQRGIHTVLEGVESRRHLSIAKSLGVDFVQGFLFRDRFVFSD